jgi:hypothetical protein
MVRDSGCAEKTSEGEAEDFFCECLGIASGAIWRGKFAGAGVAGEFEPGIADLDRRRARD